MARRRKSTGNSKTKENQNKEKNNPKTSNPESEPEDVKESDRPIPTKEALQEQPETSTSEADSNKKNEKPQDLMMPLDIQQMILGDLQGGSRREEIVVSRETVGDASEGDAELEACEVVESVREEEYEVQSEDEEGQQIIYINEDEAEEGQYVIVVNGDDFEVTGEEGQEEVMIRNLAELTEGSCEIITVVRESDYESSQESGDEVEECDNINAVIGDIDGMHCVNISQYHLDDESSNPEANSEREELGVAEKETMENDENLKFVVHHVPSESCESLEVDSENFESEKVEVSTHVNTNLMDEKTSKSETIEKLTQVESKSGETSDSRKLEVLTQVDSNLIESERSELPKIEVVTQTEENPVTQTEESIVMEVDLPDTLVTDKPNDEMKDNSIEKTECKNPSEKLQMKADISKIENIENTSVTKEQVHQKSKRKNSNQEEPRVLRRGTRKGRTRGTQPDSTEQSSVNSSENVPIEPESKLKDLNSVALRPSSLDSETTKDFLQEDKVTSNSSASENSSSNTSEETITPKSKSKINDESIDKVTTKSENSSSNIRLETNVPKTKIDKNNCTEIQSLNQDCKNEHKDVSIKDETLKVDEEKQNAARSRSGSTDTTGSESGSTSSSSRRRSGRIKSISSLKHEAESLKSVSPSVPVVSSTTTPPVPKYETDMPVKVKSRWRRSSELEMGSGNRRVQELEVISANSKLTEVATPHARPGRPSTPPYTPPPDEQVEDILSTFLQITFNEFLTDR